MRNKIIDFVFDFGAVIFEWDPVKRVEQHFKGEWYGCDSAHTLAKNIFGHPSWHDFDQGLASMDSVIAQTSKRLGIHAGRLGELIEPRGEDLAPIESSLIVLESLRARRDIDSASRIFFLSNMPKPFARALERKHAFIEWFDAGIFSADVLLAKPDVRIYKLLAERHNLSSASTLFVDDLLQNVEAAQSLGWIGLHLSKPSELPEKIKYFL